MKPQPLATHSIDVYCRQADVVGESPLWSISQQALYWLDIGARKLYRKRPAESEPRSWSLPDYPGCVAELDAVSVAIAMGEGVTRLHLESGTSSLLSAAPARAAATRFNDGKVDPRGRLWVGTMQNNFGPAGEPIDVDRFDGALYRFDELDSVATIEADVGIANTLAWSPDCRHFYFADSLREQIYRYDFDADSGEVRGKRVHFSDPLFGVPDGSAIDVDGCLWNARWDAGVLVRITPQGRLDRVIHLPVPRPTSCIFGGSRLDTLYVTSARNGLRDAQCAQAPLSGSVFAIHGLAQGLAIPAMRCRSGSKDEVRSLR